MGYGKDVREELRVPSRELRHAIPLTAAGMAAGEPGRLSACLAQAGITLAAYRLYP